MSNVVDIEELRRRKMLEKAKAKASADSAFQEGMEREAKASLPDSYYDELAKPSAGLDDISNQKWKNAVQDVRLGKSNALFEPGGVDAIVKNRNIANKIKIGSEFELGIPSQTVGPALVDMGILELLKHAISVPSAGEGSDIVPEKFMEDLKRGRLMGMKKKR